MTYYKYNSTFFLLQPFNRLAGIVNHQYSVSTIYQRDSRTSIIE